jgi:hypothetical protein
VSSFQASIDAAVTVGAQVWLTRIRLEKCRAERMIADALGLGIIRTATCY